MVRCGPGWSEPFTNSGCRGPCASLERCRAPGVITHLQQSDVFALPVRTRLGGLNPEGLGLAALEAAACGLPVVVGDSGGAPETIRDGDTGFVVPSHDHQLLAEKISLLLDNPSWHGTWEPAAAVT